MAHHAMHSRKICVATMLLLLDYSSHSGKHEIAKRSDSPQQCTCAPCRLEALPNSCRLHGAVGPAGALLAEAEDAALDGIAARLGRLLPAAGPCSAAPVLGRAVVRVPHPLMAHTPSGGLQPAKSRSVALWSGFGQAFEIRGPAGWPAPRGCLIQYFVYWKS